MKLRFKILMKLTFLAHVRPTPPAVEVPCPRVMATVMALSALTFVVRRVEDNFDWRNTGRVDVFPFDGVGVAEKVVVLEVDLTVDNF